MATKVEKRTPLEVSLYNDLKKLSKRANQRILRLERLTGQTGTFAVKQLYDYLDSDMINAISAKGRIRVSKKFNEIQLKAIIRATENFLDTKSISTVAQVKKYTKELMKETGKELTFKQSNIYFLAEKNYTWIYQYIPKSEFWEDIVDISKTEKWTKNEWVDKVSGMIYDRTLDEQLKNELINLYDYVKNK